LGRTQAAVQTVGPSALWASSVGASITLPPSGGGAQVEQPQGAVLARVPYGHAGSGHALGGQTVAPPVPSIQPPIPELPGPPATPPDPLCVPPVIVVVPPPLVSRPPAPPAAEPPLLEPPAPLDERLESLVQLTQSVQATTRPIRLVDIMRIGYPHIVRDELQQGLCLLFGGPMASIVQRFRNLQRIAASDS